MRRFGNLQVGRWAAIAVDESLADRDVSGAASGVDAIPSAIRRRMGRLERLAVRCALGVLDGEPPTGELIFCSRYGNLETLGALMRSIVAREPMSPMAFSGSVHNAAPGLVGQIRDQRLSHTAIAAGRRTFIAGLIESYAQLACGDCRDVTLVFADVALPEVYRSFEEETRPGLAIALRLELGPESQGGIGVEQGRKGVFDVLAALKNGITQIALDEALWMERAA